MTVARRVLLLGTPNSGKSTVFNALSSGGARVGNFPGTTVERLSAQARFGPFDADLVDLPGAFSLAARSPEERVAMDALLGQGEDAPGLVVLVADAPRLGRSLYLFAQVAELGLPVVVALNLVDEASRGGVRWDADGLARLLGAPVVPMVARDGVGVDLLRDAIAAALTAQRVPSPRHAWPPALEADVAALAAAVPSVLGDHQRRRALAAWLLLVADVPDVADQAEAAGFPVADARRIRGEARAAGRDPDAEIVGSRYAWIDAHLPGLGGDPVHARESRSERVDRVVLHPVAGLALFLGVMGAVFASLFAGADPAVGLIEDGLGAVSSWLTVALPEGLVRDFAVGGVVAGVGAVIVFLPQVALLFLFLALLEDCGYLARAAHLMDRVLRAAGLPGAAFVPLLSGFACAVPAILASRTMPRFRDRLLTMLVVPLTSCSARLPVYTLLVGALFPERVMGLPARPLALLGLYIFSSWVTVGAAIVLGRVVLPGATASALIELPPYRWPVAGNVVRAVWDRCRDFLHEAGRVILVASLVLWALLTFPRHESAPGTPPEVARAEALQHSVAGQLGTAIEPAIRPLGMDWQVGVGLVGAFAAREVFVATLGIVYGLGDVDEADEALRDRLRTARRPDGSPAFTPLSGVSICVFFALAMQCLSTLAVLRKETGGWRWPAFVFAYMTALAWLASFAVYQGGRALGWG
jgi:ferrous iron transport protein B